jgi:hypothetical protein
LGRTISTTLPDGSVTTTAYSVGTDSTGPVALTLVTDPLGNPEALCL